MFDIDRAARRTGCPMNAIILGAIAGSGHLPIAPKVFEEVIRSGGKAVEANLAGFATGLAYARGEVVEGPAARDTRPKVPALKGPALTLRDRIENDFPAQTHAILLEAAGRVLDYQDARYAALYLDRLAGVLSIDNARADSDFELTREVGRHLALRMTYEDIIRVAQLKTRRSRFERVHREVEAEPEQLVKITEFLKPGVEEYASVLPPFLARRIISWAGKKKGRAAKLQIGMHVRTDTVFGFANLRVVAGLRRFRRLGYRYQQEQALIENWLGLVREAAAADYALALETNECARLFKGYGDTHARGAGNFARIAEAVIRPAIAGHIQDAAKAVHRARDSALADPEGKGLAEVLSEFGAGAVSASPS
jgi:indolepyruvate ferredoxin oxidoreductase beta subunit